VICNIRCQGDSGWVSNVGKMLVDHTIYVLLCLTIVCSVFPLPILDATRDLACELA
jgi:hypothetical protein